jgi:fumarate hydratase, class II
MARKRSARWRISDQRYRFPPTFIRTLGLVKYAAVVANEALGLLDGRIATAIRDAAKEVIAGKT